MLAILAAAAATAAAPPPPAPTDTQAVEAVEIVTRAPLVGTLQQGIQAYRSEFFTPVRPGTAFDMIQWLPGFTFEETRDVRGLAGAAGNVLIDGQPPTSKNDTLSTVLKRIPAGQVERVDIIVGGAPGVDMRGRSVIANVVLKKGYAPLGAVTLQTQLFKDGRVSPELNVNLAKKFGERSVEGSLNVFKSVVQGVGPGEGTLTRRAPDGRTLFTADSEIAGYVTKAVGAGAYQFPFAGGKLKVNVSANYQKVDADERASVIGSDALYRIYILDHFKQAEFGLRYDRAFGRLNLESQFLQRLNGHDKETDSFRPPVVTNLYQEDTTSETVGRSTLRFSKSPKLTLETSAEAAYNRVDTQGVFRDHGLIVRLPAQDVTIDETRGELGVLASWKPSKAFSMTAAGKLETSHLTADGDLALTRDLTYFKPRLVVAWSPDAKTQIRLRGEHEVRQINFGDFSVTVDEVSGVARSGNPNLRPQRAWVAEAALERQFWTGASLVVTLRQSELRDVRDWLALPAYGNAIAIGNIGSGHQTDVLTIVTLPLKRFGLKGVNVKGSMTWRDSAVTDPTTGQRRRLTDQSAVIGDWHFSHDLPNWKLTWGVDATYVGPSTNYRPSVVMHVANLTRVTTFVEYRPRVDLNLRLEVANLNNPRPPFVVYSFAGIRNTAPLLYSEARANAQGAYLFFRVRKTLG
jgi:hypothetical protein